MNLWAVVLTAAMATMAAAQAETATPPPLHADANFDASCMLFASVGVMMTIVHMLRHKDEDIRRVSWELLNKSVCTLIGVMISTSFSTFLEWGTGAHDPIPSFCVNLIAFVIWYILMHVALMEAAKDDHNIINRLVCEVDDDIQQKVSLDVFKNRLHFVAPLVSIVGGCSNMKVWALGQTIVVDIYCKADLGCSHYERVASCFFMVVFNLAIMKLVHMMMVHVRDYIAKANDGILDEHEKLWMNEAVNCEDNVDTMALAFLTMQSIRYILFRHLPLPTGVNQPGTVVTTDMCIQLFLVSLFFIVCYYSTNIIIPATPKKFVSFLPAAGPRFKKLCMLVFKNCTGFSWLYLGTWLAAHLAGGRVIGAMLQAGATTVWCFFLIYLIDSLKDLECTPADVDRQLELTYQPIAVLIGFSWKLAFAGGLKTIASDLHFLPQPFEIFLLTVCTCAVMIPGWKWYILEHFYPTKGVSCPACQGTGEASKSQCPECHWAPHQNKKCVVKAVGRFSQMGAGKKQDLEAHLLVDASAPKKGNGYQI